MATYRTDDDALDRLEGTVVDGLKHGFFDSSIACGIRSYDDAAATYASAGAQSRAAVMAAIDKHQAAKG